MRVFRESELVVISTRNEEKSSAQSNPVRHSVKDFSSLQYIGQPMLVEMTTL